MLERTKRNSKVRFLSNATVERWLGENGVLSGLRYKDTVTGAQQEVPCTAICYIIYLFFIVLYSTVG